MATKMEASLPIRTTTCSLAHPLAPIDSQEIRQAVSFVRAQWPADTDLHFKSITLQEPAKTEVIPYLEAQLAGQSLPKIDRRVTVTYYIRKTNKFHEAVVNLSTGTLELNVRLGPNLHAPGDGDEIVAIERTALEDEGVQAAIAKLQLPEGSQIVIDPWIYGKHAYG
jgi:primary-amine oxidase